VSNVGTKLHATMIVLETLIVGCCQWNWTLGGGTWGWMFKGLLLSTSKEVSSCLCLVFYMCCYASHATTGNCHTNLII
jgi:hypothetical protein